MHFEFTEEQLMIRQAARDFARNECLPGVIERDEKQQFPREQVMKLAELGFMGMMVSPEYGGAGMDTVSYVLAMEEVSKIDASVSVCMSVNNSLVCWGLESFGTEEQKQKYLTPLAQGRKDGELYIGAFLLSEPEAGSDATSQRTTVLCCFLRGCSTGCQACKNFCKALRLAASISICARSIFATRCTAMGMGG